MTAPDRFAQARAIADAVLYEGYVLYPYRASSPKNQVRWQFGVLVPPAFSAADGSERWSVRTECLVEPGAGTVLTVRIRCLQVQRRSIEAAAAGDGEFAPVRQLEAGGHVYVEWDEAVERVVDFAPLPLRALEGAPHEEAFGWERATDVELVRAGGAIAGRVVRRRQSIQGRAVVTATAEGLSGRWAKVTVTVENTTPWAGASARRDEVMDQCLVAVHTMLAVDGGRFVSLLDPPQSARSAVAACSNEGTFPVLVGGDDLVLSSPIILYDHPEVAPESAGDLYDATEIDEILALRVLTLTDEEKCEARSTDPRAAAIIDRVDDFTPEMWDRMHGTVRPLRPAAGTDGPTSGPGGDGPTSGPSVPWWDPAADASSAPTEPEHQSARVPWWDPAADASVDPWADSVVVAGVEVSKGTRVTLQPTHRSDAQDLFLGGMAATVAGVFTDVDGDKHVAVTIDDDPATEELSWQGRYLFFHPDEVEPLSTQDAAG